MLPSRPHPLPSTGLVLRQPTGKQQKALAAATSSPWPSLGISCPASCSSILKTVTAGVQGHHSAAKAALQEVTAIGLGPALVLNT